MHRFAIDEVVRQIDSIHRSLTRMTVDQLLGRPSELKITGILQSHPLVLDPATLDDLRRSVREAQDSDDSERQERVLFGCMDLVLVGQTALLGEMLRVFMHGGRMHVGEERIPALEVVPWLQTQTDFDKREEMRKENTLFLKAVINPALLSILDLSVRTVTEVFGFENHARYAEAKKRISFNLQAKILRKYLEDTKETYFRWIQPWVAETIGRPMDHLSRYHALHMVRIRQFDEFFPVSRLLGLIHATCDGLGFDLGSRPDLVIDVSDSPTKTSTAMCVGVEIPGEIHVVMKPVGGFIDVETLLHETGHAFFLSHFSSELPVEYRRLYRSGSLDETFAFLFMNLAESIPWLIEVVGMPITEASRLAHLVRVKRLCLIRRYIGKFLAEKELHEFGNMRDATHYCNYLHQATGFSYEPEGYLIDMEPDFYALDYLMAWAGAHVLTQYLEDQFGATWFKERQAGDLLREMALGGRRASLENVLSSFCGVVPRLPDFADR